MRVVSSAQTGSGTFRRGIKRSAAKRRPRTTLSLTLSLSIASIIFLDQFGIKLTQDFSVSTSLICLYLLIIVSLLSKTAKISIAGIFGYLGVVCICGLSLASPSSFSKSPASFAYFVVLYLPFIFYFKGDLKYFTKEKAFDVYLDATFFLAALSIFQFFLQFVIKSPYVQNISSIFPEGMLVSGRWNTSIDASFSFKANGFFQREPSFLSQWLGIGVIIEFLRYRRPSRLAVYAVGMLLSLSGTGIFILAAAFGIPRNWKTLLRAVFFALVAWMALISVDSFVFNGYFYGRLSDFSVEGTSSYARFIAPGEIVRLGLSDVAETLIGNGAGAYRPAVDNFNSPWEIHDPTWAKLIFEYGFLGSTALGLYLLFAIVRSSVATELKIGFAYAWLASGGQLINPTFELAMFVLVTAWRRQGGTGNARARPGQVASPG